jgi:hypothetical protein
MTARKMIEREMIEAEALLASPRIPVDIMSITDKNTIRRKT